MAQMDRRTNRSCRGQQEPGGGSGDPWHPGWALSQVWACLHCLPYLPGHVRFIDYEYAGYNYQAFDIGNHFNEFAGEGRSCGTWTQGSVLVMGTRSTGKTRGGSMEGGN